MKNKMLLALLSLSLFSVGSMQSTVVYEDDNGYDYNEDSCCCKRRRSCRSCHRSCRSCKRSCCPRYYNSFWYTN